MLLLKICHPKDRPYSSQPHRQSMWLKNIYNHIELEFFVCPVDNILNFFVRSVKDLARLSLRDPLYISAHEHSVHTTPESLQQNYIVCALGDKLAMLWSFIRNHLKQKIIVFFTSCKQVSQGCSCQCSAE